MHLFSSALLAIYRASTEETLQEFQTAAIHSLHECFQFDAVVLGATQFYSRPGIYIIGAHIDGLPRTFMDDYLPLLSRDPIMRSLLAGLNRPLLADLHFYYQNLNLVALADFADQYHLHQVMTFGDMPRSGHPTRWIMFFMDGESGFSPAQQKRLANLWPHISQATSICDGRVTALRNLAPPTFALALLNHCGEIEYADARFVELLQLEWPERDIACAARQVQAQLLEARTFKGKCIEITMVPDSASVCQARPTAALAAMTPRETLVARRFAAGLSHKEVARELGISPNTVRTQLTHIYSKLRLHDKGALANYLLSQTAGGSPDRPH
ncbi:response regulator transcription factor [Pseudoduganella sp. UC29_106]|uniref:response regulator transcription factor n=1 Tax=Pseudoduganella sp. UC29_106 TaxID=3374553 RepID=UPI003756EC46